jgi:hypothetical protein
MKNQVKTRGQFIMDIILWAFMVVVVFILMVGSANAQPIQSEVVTVSQKGKNPYLKKYHKQNRKNFKCSACPDRGLKRLLPKSWR